MSNQVRFTRLVQRTNDEGSAYLVRWFGSARIIGRPGKPTDDGSPTWNIVLAEPDEQVREARERNRQQWRERQDMNVHP